MLNSSFAICTDDLLASETAGIAGRGGLDAFLTVRASLRPTIDAGCDSFPIAPGEPNAESLEAISEGDFILASGKKGRFTSGADLIVAAMEW